MTLLASALTIATVSTGLNIKKATFQGQSRRGAYGQDKSTRAGTLAENGRGLMCDRGCMGGILR